MSNDKSNDTPIEAEIIEETTPESVDASTVEQEQPSASDAGPDSGVSETLPEPSREPAKRGGKTGLVIAVLALLLAGATAGGGYYLYHRLQQQVGILSPAIERNSGRIGGAEQRDTQLSGAIDAQRAALERQGKNLQEAIDALRAQIGRDQSGWVLAETEYLMLVANHRLQLERDVTTAAAALRIADTRLRDTGDPALIDVREKLAAEIAALDAVARPDLTGLALRVAGLAGQVDQLPLKGTYQPAKHAPAAEAAAPETTSGWQRLTSGIWRDLKRLVTVRRTDEAVRPMLAPEQQYFLRQNLRLQLDAARLALLRGDVSQLHLALQTAQEWLTRYFDERSAAVSSMREAMDSVAAVDIHPALPDISGSLKALRAHMRAAGRSS